MRLRLFRPIVRSRRGRVAVTPRRVYVRRRRGSRLGMSWRWR